jgi:hypothetical protein
MGSTKHTEKINKIVSPNHPSTFCSPRNQKAKPLHKEKLSFRHITLHRCIIMWLMPDGRLQCAIVDNSANKITNSAR